MASILHGSGFTPFPSRQIPLAKSLRNLFARIKFVAVLRFATTYPAIGIAFKVLQKIRPSLAANQAAHMEFTRIKVEKRLKQETDRKDFLSYVRLPFFSLQVFC